ncbi:MAG: NAD-binding protein, partial [Candidatus Riflebacteria bacterium]|nr:NAD-binding protein [Candidatus Riflebacteria bacterium]
YFGESHGLTPQSLGIDEVVFPEAACAESIIDALLRPAVKESVTFSHPDAELTCFQLLPGSPLVGRALSEFPRTDLLQQLRVCAILRYGQLIIPRGESGFISYDEVYVAGARSVVNELLTWARPHERPMKRVILAGSSSLADRLARRLSGLGMSLTLVESDRIQAERSAETLGGQICVIAGSPTESRILKEAGVSGCDAFIATGSDNESNILGCILARRSGARKVIATVHQPDFLPLIVGIPMVDCAFSPMVTAINSLIRCIGTEHRRIVAVLKRTPAEILEMSVLQGSRLAGKAIRDLSIPRSLVFALILREARLVPAIGPEILLPRDRVVVMAHSGSTLEAEQFFGVE